MNLKEFSKKTGIPISTISKALGNYKDVSVGTREKIIALAKQYNYVPNLYAKTLASGTTSSVGWVLPLSFSHIQKLTLINFIQKIHSNLNAANIPVVMIFAKDKKEEIEAYEKLINFYKVRLILLNDIRKNDHRIKYLDSKGIGYITWGRCGKDPKSYSWIDEDIEYGSDLAVDYLLSKGHRKIGYIDAASKVNYFLLRKKFFVKSLQKNNIIINDNFFLDVFHDQKKSKLRVKEFIKDNKEVTVLLVSSHTFATYAIDACRELNREIGRELSLVSFDADVLPTFSPHVTTISQPVDAVTKHLVKLIESKIKYMGKSYQFLYKPKLIERKSVSQIS